MKVLSEAEIEKLAEAAHDVWMEGKFRDGWVLASTTNKELKQHSCLVPYGELGEADKQSDRDLVLGMPAILGKAGLRFGVARNPVPRSGKEGLRLFQCFKQVEASKIGWIHPIDGENTKIMFANGGEVKVPDEWLKKHSAQEGGYFVSYPDGYQSYSPAEAFEAGYFELPEGTKGTMIRSDRAYAITCDRNLVSSRTREELVEAFSELGFKVVVVLAEPRSINITEQENL